MGSHGNASGVSYFRRRVHLRSRTHEFHYSPEKRCGKLGPYVSFNEIHLLYSGKAFLPTAWWKEREREYLSKAGFSYDNSVSLHTDDTGHVGAAVLAHVAYVVGLQTNERRSS